MLYYVFADAADGADLVISVSQDQGTLPCREYGWTFLRTMRTFDLSRAGKDGARIRAGLRADGYCVLTDYAPEFLTRTITSRVRRRPVKAGDEPRLQRDVVGVVNRASP